MSALFRPAVLVLAFFAGLGFVPAHAQERIVSIGGDITEMIYAMGQGDRIVATDSTSVYPAAAEETPKVGYMRQLSAEGVLSVEPDLILISGAARPAAAVELLRQSGVRMIEMEPVYTIEAITDKVRRVAQTLGVETESERLVAEIEADWADARAEIAAFDRDLSALFFAALRDGAPRAAGDDTAAAGIIRLIGAENVFAGQSGYKTLSLEAAVAADPDIILVMSHHAERVGGYDAVINHPALSLTGAAQNRRVFLVDQVTVMQFGPRAPRAVADLAKAINQALSAQDDPS